MKIIDGNITHIDECIEMTRNSEIGKRYFNDGSKKLYNIMERGIKRDELKVMISSNGNCIGFIMVTDNGAFDMYPYLHLIIVHEDYRGKGYGSILMEYYENEFYPQSRKLFLLVGKFNNKAEKLYSRLGYIKCGEIEGFYKPSETEIIMVKSREIE
ncbi:GNAT family N-acetyltransferase [Tissierella carlieri]|uniref:GNAT family N-acetyltransferase n=1 Tax=Tissierella carlieri TaxID=689904 RepID=A0ABT1SB22_9FIRM|nr:GNAT family N-acetyltransferase [Tissierella carlieri]MCQ4923658.1 GNAT family N-acetyltransferase [Tissierella carlieri]